MKQLALKIMRRMGVFSAARSLSARMGRVVMYHDFCGIDDPNSDAVRMDIARKHLEHLRRHFRVVPLSVMAEQVGSGRGVDEKSVAITIDDGRRNFYEFYYPLLQEFEMPATFFVVTSFIDGVDWIWTDKVLWLSRQAGAPAELAPRNLKKLFASLNRQRPKDRDARITSLACKAGVTIPAKPPAPYQGCTWHELRAMARSGLVEIGSHTSTHAILSSISDDESWKEIADSRRRIESSLGIQVLCFCPPNGTPEDYRPSQVRQVKEAGYSCLVTTTFGYVNGRTDPYAIPRIGAGRSDLLTFYKRIDGPMYYRHQLGQMFGNCRQKSGSSVK